MKPFLFLCLTLFLFAAIGKAQPPCTTLGQTPATAFPACGTSTFTQNNVPVCANGILATPCTGATYQDAGPFYYRFTCYIAGTLGFVIDPINNSDDYDWALYDITGQNPSAIYTNVSLNIAENWSATPGNTGASAAGTSLSNCAGNTPNFSRMPSLIVGHEYLLMVSNFSASQQGYTLTFTGGSADIADPVAPALASTNVDCGGQQVNIIFKKKMRCSSLAGDRSDFVITPSVGPIATVGGFGCLQSFDMDSAYLTFATPLPPGTYTLTMANGTDGNTLLDNCGTAIPVGDNVTFTVPPRPPIGAPNNVTFNPPSDCTPVSIVVYFPDAVQCGTAALDGSDFIITGPSPVTVDGIIPICSGNSLTNGFTLHFSAPITVSGTYTVQITTGSDGNTLLGLCNRPVPSGSSVQFTVNAQTPIPMGTVTIGQCSPTSLTLTFSDLIQCNSIAANGSDFAVIGPSGVTITGATAVNCNNGETNTITLQFASPINVPGNYQVQAMTGGDGNTLLGQCKLVPAGATSPFTINVQPAIAMGTVSPPPCTPQFITLNFAEPINCNSIAANGSDFIVTGPSAVVVNSATPVNCNTNGETTSITIQFSAPVSGIGTFDLQMATGSDGNTLIGQCGRQVTAGSLSSFTLAAQPPLPMGTVATTNCAPSSIVLNFTDNIRCNSIAANGSDFIITGPAPVTITSATSTCNANGETNSITLQFSAPILVSGNFNVQMAAGSDGNTLIGVCNRQTVAGDIAAFTIPPASPVPMDSLVPIACAPGALRLIFREPIRCSSIAANGSDFTITGPFPVTINSATGACNANGLTSSIDIQLASPIVRGGLYILQLTGGNDGNTLLSDCYRQTPAGASLSFIPSDTVSAAFLYQVQYDCTTDVITFSHNGQHNVNQWAWTVNGAAASNQQTFTQSFSASSNNNVQLAVSNGICNDIHSENIVLNNKVTVDFIAPESVCPEDTISFIEKTTGQVDNWQWTFGNGNTSTLQIPPRQIYPLTGSEILYPVTLQISNNLGCSASTTKTVRVLSGCIIAVPTAFTPNNDGKNDYLYPLNALKAENLDFKVFNRWGQLVFHSKDWLKKWDGRVNGLMQGTNVYVWTLTFTHRDTKQKYSMKGTTTLIR